MTGTENTQHPSATFFDTEHSQSRVITLNVCLLIGIISSAYFGIIDTVQRNLLNAIASFAFVVVFILIFILNSYVPVFRKVLNIGFAALVAVALLTLLATQFTGPPIVFWCFIFPVFALFLLGHRYGMFALIFYNAAIICVFIVDANLPHSRYDFYYVIRFCAPMVVISLLAYYYETRRLRSITSLNHLNLSLEKRIEEKTKAFEESQKQLHQIEKMEAIGQLAGGIAHDFNNQLTGILGYADMLREELSDNPELSCHADNIILATKRASDLTSQLLAFARKGMYLSVSVDIHKIISEVVSILQRTISKRIVVKQHLDAQQAYTQGDPTQIQNAVLNVALNARDAMPDGGELIFETSIIWLDAEYCRTNPYEIKPGAYVLIGITDNGIGMDEASQKRMFEPFYTTKEQGKGTGMGLASVYGTLKNHGGAVTVYSEPGRGTKMNLYLPHLPSGTTPENADEHVEPAQGSAHVLIVDDEEFVLATASAMLRKYGYRVSQCRNGKEAVTYFNNNWKSIDIVILDMVMPEMDGKETFAEMVKVNPGVRVLLSSGFSINGEAQQLLDAGVMGFLQKPYRKTELTLKVEEVLSNNP